MKNLRPLLFLSLFVTIPFFYGFRASNVSNTEASSNAKDTVEVEQAIPAEKEVTNTPPEFPGGEDALLDYLGQKLRYPDSAIKNKVEGIVILKFGVTPEGKIEDIEVVEPLTQDCNREAVKVVEHMPKWNPGTENGKPVYAYFTLPIEFRLHRKNFQINIDPKSMKADTLIVELDGKVVSYKKVNNKTFPERTKIDVEEIVHDNNKVTKIVKITTGKGTKIRKGQADNPGII